MWRLQNDAAGCGYWASTLSLNEYSHAADLRRGRIAARASAFGVFPYSHADFADLTDVFMARRKRRIRRGCIDFSPFGRRPKGCKARVCLRGESTKTAGW